MTALKETFAVSKAGLAKILARRGLAFAVIELVQNAFDEASGIVTVFLEPIPNTRRYRLTVQDDSPLGFADISHAYTLFAENNAKKSQPEKRGRFNLGEKLVIAICTTARITTTTGTVEFSAAGRRHLRSKTKFGSVFEGELAMTRGDALEVERLVNRIIVPKGKTLSFNGHEIEPRIPVRTFETTLPTEIADEEGYLRPTRRKTTVGLYRPIADDPTMLYELGLPVVDIGDHFEVNIGQKIPLNMDRDNVTPAYLRELRTAVLNNSYDLIEGDSAAETWIDNALEDPGITTEALKRMLNERYTNPVIYDPSDIEANKLAVSTEHDIIHGGAFSREAWQNIRRSGVVLPAGQVTPSPKPYSDDPNAPVRKVLPRDEWTPDMERIAELTCQLGIALMDVRVGVEIVNDPKCMNFGATYGRGGLFEYNLRTLGRHWFEKPPDDEELLALIIHEFGHESSGDHLSSGYHKALCRLGARLARLIRRNPTFFEQFERDTTTTQSEGKQA